MKLKIKKEGFSDRINVLNRSAHDTKFKDEIFDIIWEEGVMHLLDFKKAMTECSRILKKDGYLITGEATNWAKTYLTRYPKYGFKLMKKIPWAENCWWKEYYSPLDKRIIELRKKYENIDDFKEIKQYLREIEMVKKNTKGFECTTYILRKIK